MKTERRVIALFFFQLSLSLFFRPQLDDKYAQELPSTLILKTAAVAVGFCWLARFLANVADVMLEKGVLQSTLNAFKTLPFVSGLVQKEKDKISKKMQVRLPLSPHPLPPSPFLV